MHKKIEKSSALMTGDEVKSTNTGSLKKDLCMAFDFQPSRSKFQYIYTYECGKESGLRIVKIPKLNFPHFISQRSMSNISRLSHIEVGDTRRKVILDNIALKKQLRFEKEKRLSDFKVNFWKKQNLYGDFTADVVRIYSEIKQRYSEEKEKLLRLRNLSDFQSFSRFVGQCKCQAIRSDQLKELKMRHESHMKELAKPGCGLFEDSKNIDYKEKARKAKEQHLHFECLHSKMKEIDIVKGSLAKLMFLKNADWHNKCLAIRQYRALKSQKKYDDLNEDWRRDLKTSVICWRKVRKLIEEEENILAEQGKICLPSTKDFVCNNDRIREIYKKRAAAVHEMCDQRKMEEERIALKSVLSFIKKQNIEGYNWRQEEMTKAETRRKELGKATAGLARQTEARRRWAAVEVERGARQAQWLRASDRQYCKLRKEEAAKRKQKQAEIRESLNIETMEKKEHDRECFELRRQDAVSTEVNRIKFNTSLSEEMAKEIIKLRKEGLPEEYITSILCKFNIPTAYK